MLTDPERKMLNILRNYSISHHLTPPLYLLQAKTGRDEIGIRKVLSGLAEKGYINWSMDKPISSLELIQAWEEQPLAPPVKAPNESWWEALADERSP